jgi:hypothetical protein
MVNEHGVSEEGEQQVEDWLCVMSLNGEVGDVDTMALRGVLEGLGLNIDRLDEVEDARKSLHKYTNGASRYGVAVGWGKKRVEEYKAWCAEQVEEIEEQSGMELPGLDESGSKVSGMLQFFHEITALAAGELSMAKFTKYMQVRLKNGQLWQDGRKGERIKVTTPISKGDAVRIASIPPGFIPKAWEWLQSTKGDSNEK